MTIAALLAIAAVCTLTVLALTWDCDTKKRRKR